MKKQDGQVSEKASIRIRAEQIQQLENAYKAENFEPESVEEMKRLLHELRVHQIELNLQNEELRSTQHELQILTANYFDLYDMAPVGYCSIDENGIIIQANLTFSNMIETPRKQIVMQKLSSFIYFEDQDILYKHQKELLMTDAPQKCELRMLKNKDTQLWVRIVGNSVLDEHDNKICRIVLTDITESKKAEEEYRLLEMQNNKNQNLESLGILAGGIAHDFNNLMAGIYGYIELANEHAGNLKTSEYLSKAMDTIDRAKSLTSQLLTFAKGGDPVPKPTALFPYIKDVVKMSLSGANVSSKFQIEDNLWNCKIDKNQVSQVVDNLIINAQQAMPKGGTIEINAQNISIIEKDHPTLTKGDYVKISIKDFGVGISEEIMPHIFDPFFTTKDGGHGLGLPTSYSIIKRHNGCLNVESEPGKGTTFHIYLPATNDHDLTSAEPSVENHKGSGTFVVMDDEKIIRETLKDLLASFGYSVVCKENGRDTIDFFFAELQACRKVAGMIFDLTIPGGMGGVETIAEVRKLCNETPVFVLSGYTNDPVMANPTEYGFTDSICKPFKLSMLSEILNKYIV